MSIGEKHTAFQTLELPPASGSSLCSFLAASSNLRCGFLANGVFSSLPGSSSRSEDLTCSATELGVGPGEDGRLLPSGVPAALYGKVPSDFGWCDVAIFRIWAAASFSLSDCRLCSGS